MDNQNRDPANQPVVSGPRVLQPTADILREVQSQPAAPPVPSTVSPSNPAASVQPALASVAPPPPQPQASTVNTAPKKSGHKAKLLMIVILILVVIGAILGYRMHSNKQQAGNSKKDIPYLTYGFYGSGDIPQIYPIETSDTNNTIFDDSQLFEGLVGYKNAIDIVPLLATSWANPNDTSWIFNLRHNVKFHTGRTMTATDVAYSLNYDVAHQGDSQGDTALAFASSISKVKVINPYQVEITTNGPDATFLNQLDYLYIIDSKAKPGDPNAGTGPYTVQGDSINPNANSLNLIAFDNYWGGHVYTRQVHIQEYATIDQLSSDVANGKIDFAGDFDAQQLGAIKAKYPNYQQIKIPDLGVSYLELNTEKASSPLFSLAARQAVGYALNKQAILKAGGLLGTQASQLIPLAIPGYNPAIKNTPYDPAKAKQLLNGVANLSTPVTLVYPNTDEGQADEIAKELDAVGFSVKLSRIGDLGTLVDMEFAGQGDMFYLSYISSTEDGLDIINNTVYGTQNFSSTDLSNLVNQTSVAVNPTSRIADLQKIENLVAAQVPAVPLYTVNRVYALTKPYVVSNDLPDILSGTYFWQTYQK